MHQVELSQLIVYHIQKSYSCSEMLIMIILCDIILSKHRILLLY